MSLRGSRVRGGVDEDSVDDVDDTVSVITIEVSYRTEESGRDEGECLLR